MLHKTLTADTVDVDQGTFTAIVSSWSSDREGDLIARSAFDKTIAAWRSSGKRLPLLFEHSTTVVGAVDPHSMQATAAGLVVAGEVDRSTDEGRQVWRSIKGGTAGFSIGFLSESRARKGGGRELTEVDLLEISYTSKPMHPLTRATGWKSATDDELPSEADQRRRAARLMLTPEQERDVDQWVSVITEAISGTKATAPATKSSKPIRVATFTVE